MSCSQFIEHDEEDKSDTLVIIVNGDGTVTVDPLTLERVLSQQSRAAVGVIRFENSDEPDSQTENVLTDENDKIIENKEKSCRKVNLVIEGYYPSASSNAADRNVVTESVVSSTVGTPPLPTRNSSEFLDLLSEGLEIPVSQSPTQSNMHAAAGEGGIGDSLVDAFSEMAPEQLKQVETALHSEKAKHILGDDVTCVLDTLKLNDEHDDWVHLDHCYTNIYGSKKQGPAERMTNVVVQDSEMATMLTIKVGANDDRCISSLKDTSSDVSDSSNAPNESLELTMPENVQVINVSLPAANETNVESGGAKKKNVAQSRAKLVIGNRVVPLKGSLSHHLPDFSMKNDRSSPIAAVSQKAKRKSKENVSRGEVVIAERVVTEDEVDGVKVFKPTRSDKRSNKTSALSFSKDMSSILKTHPHLVQSKLNSVRKLDPTIDDASNSQCDKETSGDDVATKDSSDAKNAQTKKECNARKTSTPVTPETFGPALFSTPDIIRKINAAAAEGGSGGETAACYSKDDEIAISVDQQTADIEKRMSALENGEAILDQLHLQVEMQKEMERITSQSDDDKLLSDLENSADEDQVDANVSGVVANTISPMARNYNSGSNLDFNLDLDLDVEDFENENYQSTAFKADNCDKSENSDKNEGEYEDDPNKLWCLCNKPHNNRFMICCDACDNWFHGKCVGISKAIGEKMEQDGTEWLCPSCRKEKFAKERENKLKMPTTKSTASRLANRHGRSELAGVAPGSSSSSYGGSCDGTTLTSPLENRPAAANAISGNAVGEVAGRRKSWSSNCDKAAASFCVECKVNENMPNAVYCSADCLLAYVANSLKSMNNGQRIPLSEDRKIIVFDRKSGHRISGARAPAVGNLKEWLLQHPSFEIDRPYALPTCRPSYASTFTKPVPKKVVGLATKSKESLASTANILPSAAVAVAASVGVVKPSSSRIIQTTKPSKTIRECSANDGMAQISMKQYVVKKSCVETIGASKDVAATAASAAAPVRKDDFKSKDKQRQIKIIPIQPLPSKPIEEHKEKSATTNRKLVTVGATIAASTPSVANAATSAAASTHAAIVATNTHAVSERKKKPEMSRKAEPKRAETKKKETIGPNETNSSSNVASAAVPNPDTIRASVRKTLNELFANKMKESSDIKLSDEEVSSLASLVEEEIFALHNKDTGSKYKNKYRQLLFNIKQPQNTLFRRIALEKTLSPYELVRLTADEMACTELAEWRQREAKHEIDMIKKTELENLQQSKVLVLKTHKGELEIESEPLPPCKPDLIVPDLQPEDVPEEKDKSAVKKTLPYYFGKDKGKEKELVTKDGAPDKKSMEKESAAAAAATKEKHRKHHDRKDKRKSNKNRRRSVERERHGSASRKRGKSSHGRSSGSPTVTSVSSHRSRSAEKSDGGRGRGDDRANEKHSRNRSRHDSDASRSKSKSKQPRSRSTSRKRKEKSCERSNDDGGGGGSGSGPSREQVAVKNEDELVAAGVAVADATVVKAELDEIAAELLNPFKSVDVDLSDMEPTSTVTIKTPPYSRSPAETTPYVWKGTIVMPDVVRVNVALKQVSGNCEALDDDLHSGENSVMGRIDCVGRIGPATVWDYISKVKKSGNKDILVLRFECTETADQNGYLSLYSYLNTKNRMAVVGNTGAAIKDFYVMPLASHSPIPQILLPLDGPGFEDCRPHLLLAVVVRSRRRKYHQDQLHHFSHHHQQQQTPPQQTQQQVSRLHNHHRHHHHHHHHHHVHHNEQVSQQKHQASSSSLSSMQSDERLLEHEPYVPSTFANLPFPQNQYQQPDSFTPPHSPTSVFVQTPRVPVTSTVLGNEEDEPYSPKDDDDESNNNINNDDEDDEINNDDDNDVTVREVNDVDDDDEPYSPSALDEQQCKPANDDDSDNCLTDRSKLDESADSSNFLNNGDRVELYSPSEHFFNDIESSEVTLPATLKNLLNRVKNRTTQPLLAEAGGTILEADPIVHAYKKNVADKSDEEIEDATCVENSYTPPPIGVINLDDDDDGVDNQGDDGGGGDSNSNNNNNNNHHHEDDDDRDDLDMEVEVGGCGDHDGSNAGDNGDGGAATTRDHNVDGRSDGENAHAKRTYDSDEENTYRRVESTAVTSLPAIADLAEESKSNRDPRRKTTAVAVTVISQPPPPGMEDEFSSLAAASKSDAVNSMAMGSGSSSAAVTDVAYTTQMPYAYASPYAAMIPPPQATPSQMYLTSAAVYSQSATSLPFAALATANAPPPPQMYAPPLPLSLPLPPPTAVHRTDPSLIPLPIDVADNKRSCEKRKLDDGKDDDSNDDRKSSDFKTFKKRKSYYTPDSKSVDSAKSSPNRSRRHRSSSYESHRRVYQRDDVESTCGTVTSSRYGNKYGGGSSSGGSSSSRSYRERGGGGGGYWKSGNDFSSSSHKRYSRNSGSGSGSDKDRSSSSKRSRWESSKYDHDDRDADSKKDRERDKSGEHSRKSESSRHIAKATNIGKL